MTRRRSPRELERALERMEKRHGVTHDPDAPEELIKLDAPGPPADDGGPEPTREQQEALLAVHRYRRRNDGPVRVAREYVQEIRDELDPEHAEVLRSL